MTAIAPLPARVRKRPLHWVSQPLGLRALMAASLAVLATPTLAMLARQSWTDEQAQQGPLVLVIGAWLLWRRWPILTQGGAHGRMLVAAAAFAPCALAYIVGRMASLYLLEAYALYGCLVVGLYLLVGASGLRRAVFPLVFIAFAAPIPFAVGWPVTVALRLGISEGAVDVMRLCHLAAARDGLTIYVENYRIEIAQACSGMNSLLALSALSVCYLHLRRDPPLSYWAILSPFVVTFAVAANFLRVLLLCAMTLILGDGLAQGVLHELLGLATFVFALVLTFAADEALGRTHWAHARRSS